MIDLSETPPEVDNKCTVIILQPELEVLSVFYVIDNLLEKLSSNWDIILFCSDKNIEFYSYKFEKLVSNSRVSLVNLSSSSLFSTHPEESELNYDLIMTNKKFYELVPTETFLVFQSNAVVVNASLLEQFTMYDISVAVRNEGVPVVMRGVSLRKKSKILEILNSEDFDIETHKYEIDFFLSSKVPFTLPPDVEQAKQFSIENIYSEDAFCICCPYNRPYSIVLNVKFNEVLSKLNNLIIPKEEYEKYRKQKNIPEKKFDEMIVEKLGKNYFI